MCQAEATSRGARHCAGAPSRDAWGLLIMEMARWRHHLALVLVAGGLLGCGAEPLHPFLASRSKPLIFAHRGGGGITPEETLPTFLRAQGEDASAVIEMDVRRTADGALVLLHDETVDRTTNGTGAVASLTLAQVQALDAGHCARPGVGDGTAAAAECRTLAASQFPFRGQGYRVPLLTEVLAALPLGTSISVELKVPGPEAEVARLVRESGHLPNAVVGSESDEIAERLRDLLPGTANFLPRNAAVCFTVAAKTGVLKGSCPDYALFASPLEGAGLALDTERVINGAHSVGMAMVYWTINSEPVMERLFLRGADGVFTDYPDRARSVIARLRRDGRLP